MAEETILIVDDEPAIRDLCRSILNASGYRTLTAENGHHGLGLLRSNGAVDLIVSDMAMPVMDGIEFVRRVFESDPHANIILMTAYAPHDMPSDELQRVCKLLRKPFRPSQLVAAVNTCLGDRTNDRAAAR
jgi:DNA-binding NtrC family response regulator